MIKVELQECIIRFSLDLSLPCKDNIKYPFTIRHGVKYFSKYSNASDNDVLKYNITNNVFKNIKIQILMHLIPCLVSVACLLSFVNFIIYTNGFHMLENIQEVVTSKPKILL